MAVAPALTPVSVQVPMVDLRDALSAADVSIQRNLAQLHRRGQYILGPQTADFEQAFALAVGAATSVGVSSGTAALELCLRAAGISGEGCDVILPAMTSLFTAQAVLAVGARLRVADVSPDNLLLTASEIDKAWTPNTRAVIAVHLYGQPCLLDQIAALCRQRGAVLIQDACQAHGARFQGLPLTHFSPYCAYSFYPTKNLGALGDGGAVATSDPEIATRVRLLRDGGRQGDQTSQMLGLNARLDEMQACYLRAFLPFLPSWNARRRGIATYYRDALVRTTTPLLHFDDDSVNHLAVLRTPHRDALRQHLASCGVQTGIHYPVPIHLQPGFAPYASWAEEPRVAARASTEILSLPVAPHVSQQMAEAVVRSVSEFAP